jgi:hypothetical protein
LKNTESELGNSLSTPQLSFLPVNDISNTQFHIQGAGKCDYIGFNLEFWNRNVTIRKKLSNISMLGLFFSYKQQYAKFVTVFC